MKTIYKYQAPTPGGFIDIKVPIDWEPLFTGYQQDRLYVWAKVSSDPDAIHKAVRLTTIGTGWRFVNLGLRYIGTVFQDVYVWHVFSQDL